MTNIIVKKRDGTTQDFQRSKVYRSVLKAGGPEELAEDISTRIGKWAEQDPDKTVLSAEIRDQLLVHLDKENPEAARAFRNYEQQKTSID